MKKTPILLALVLALGLAAPPSSVEAAKNSPAKIKKCQDAQGKWHYGDRAAQACERSEIIELSDEGLKTRVIDAPLTEEELRNRAEDQAEAEADRKRAEEQARRDRQLLSTYGHENDIKFIRDRKLDQIESSISATAETVKPLRAALKRMEAEAAAIMAKGKEVSKELSTQILKTRQQIIRHEGAIAKRRKEQEAIRQRAEADLQRYRELKANQSLSSAPTGKTP
ncbi:MAG: hypothetical protein BMS9Abin10_0212 [Gammaproteobacteria bacterium]|nr:MAG: hypothetical protein BMS9Abin10_0212 [Gammaproteobacteria bacterium]